MMEDYKNIAAHYSHLRPSWWNKINPFQEPKKTITYKFEFVTELEKVVYHMISGNDKLIIATETDALNEPASMLQEAIEGLSPKLKGRTKIKKAFHLALHVADDKNPLSLHPIYPSKYHCPKENIKYRILYLTPNNVIAEDTGEEVVRSEQINNIKKAIKASIKEMKYYCNHFLIKEILDE